MSDYNRPKGWFKRGYLPHFNKENMTQSITFRLYDSYPSDLLEKYRRQISEEFPPEKQDTAWRKKVESILDKGYGECWLQDPTIAGIVQGALLYFDKERYDLHAWCVMPSHVHVLITQYPGHALSSILNSWRSFTANRANKVLGRTGHFWARGYWDRFIRNERHFQLTREYIERNPVKAGLCRQPEDWAFSSAGYEHPEPRIFLFSERG